MEACAKELAARLLAKVIKRTPVGQYPSGSGKVGGTLRRGWTAGKNQNAISPNDRIGFNHSRRSAYEQNSSIISWAVRIRKNIAKG